LTRRRGAWGGTRPAPRQPATDEETWRRSILGIGIDYQQVINGLVPLAAVFVDVYNKRDR
jgi:hypothetical protein